MSNIRWRVTTARDLVRVTSIVSLISLTPTTAGRAAAQSTQTTIHSRAHAVTRPAYPLEVSIDRRYLVDQDNVPFLLMGDSPQALIANLSAADANMFFADRAANGFN